ncbi:THAP domain containing 9, partial [Caligus rogercresseyi]
FQLRKNWERSLRRKNYQAKDSHVLCSEHFLKSDITFERNRNRKCLKQGAIPCKFIFSKVAKPRTTMTSIKSSEPLILGSSITVNRPISDDDN